jgi:signal transduction histidine kinase
MSDSKPRFDVYGDLRRMESLYSELKLLLNPFPYSRGIKKDRIKARYIIEVTRDNINYCKELMKIINLRHLDNLKGNFVLYQNKYIFLCDDNRFDNKCDREVDKEEKNTSLLVDYELRSQIVKQQQRFFDTLWDNATPAGFKIKEIENSEMGSSHIKNIGLIHNIHDRIYESQSNSSDCDSKNIVKVIRNQKDIEYLLLSIIYNSRSEVLLTVSSLEYLNHLAKIGLKVSIKHALDQGAKIIILYPELRNKEITVTDTLYLISNTKENVQFESIAGTMGSVLIVDNSKILLLNTTEGEGREDKNHYLKVRNADIIGVYSGNKSIVNNYGALFDTLLNEKETVRFASKVKEQLESSINQLTESNQKLKNISESHHEFINLAAHELRTPTQAIIGYIEMINEFSNNKDTYQGYLKAIVRNANRLEQLVEDLLDVARIESNTMTLNKEKTNLEQLINTVVQDFRVDIEKQKKKKDKKFGNKNDDELQKKKIEINISLDTNNNNNNNNDNHTDFYAMVDRSKIVQAISNLISNSLNSIASNKTNGDVNGGGIDIQVSKIDNNGSVKANSVNDSKQNKRNEILVSIRDTGKGIDSEILPRLFTKFATNSPSGTGLGLYLTKSIVEGHGGKIWAENNSNGNGATFRFTIPIA